MNAESKRAVYIPAIRKHVPLGAYVRAVKKAKENPDAQFKHSLESNWPATGAQIHREFLKGMHDRINQRIPYMARGRSSEEKQ